MNILNTHIHELKSQIKMPVRMYEPMDRFEAM